MNQAVSRTSPPRSRIARIGLGTVQWGLRYGIANRSGRPGRGEIRMILEHAIDHGVDLLDTAAGYGDAEEILGELHAGHRFRIVTKVLGDAGTDGDRNLDVAGSVRRSLDRLRIGSVHGLLVHDPRHLLSDRGPETWESLQRVQVDGLVEKLGVSVYDPEELRAVLDRFQVQLVQLPFSVYDRRFLDSGLLAELKASGVEVHSRSTFLQGLLLLKPRELPISFQAIREHHMRWYELVASSGASPVEAALQFCLSEPTIDRVLVGCESVRQFDELAEAAAASVSTDCRDFALQDPDILNPSRWTT